MQPVSPPATAEPNFKSDDSSFHRHIKSVLWLRWLFVTKDDQVVIVQLPNAPLCLAFLADVISYFSSGQVRTASAWAAQGLFMIWAIMEIGWGVNPFRRILGGIVFGLVGFALFRKLT